MAVDPILISRRFGLGEPVSRLRPLTGGGSSAVWALHTTAGRWVVKTLLLAGAWQRDRLRVAGALEQAAFTAGVPMPRPVEAIGEATLGYWAQVDADRGYARVQEWVDGTSPSPADTTTAAWLGETLAAIERLALPGDPTTEDAYPLHPVAEWHIWLDQAAASGVLSPAQLRHLLPAVVDATALVAQALTTRPEFVLAHRDASRRNILMTARDPVLLDFDHAGPEVGWWELVHHLFDLSSPTLGCYPPHAACVRAGVTGYVLSGGQPGPADATAFTGLVRAMLAATAYELWLALGHRRVDEDRRAAARATVHDAANRLPAILRSLDRWAAMLD